MLLRLKPSYSPDQYPDQYYVLFGLAARKRSVMRHFADQIMETGVEGRDAH